MIEENCHVHRYLISFTPFFHPLVCLIKECIRHSSREGGLHLSIMLCAFFTRKHVKNYIMGKTIGGRITHVWDPTQKQVGVNMVSSDTY